MQKAKVYNIADSNIANLGTDLEKNVKHAASEHEAAWKAAGKSVGIQIWRIENFKVVPLNQNTHGQFFSGDSYIVLHTYKKTPQGEALAYDVYFWLGKYTTQDEAGTAAYKTVELDDFLNGLPVQHREVQEYESKPFLSLFPKGIRIQEGGAESGFHHVEAGKYRPRLLQVKGKKHIRVTEVPLARASLNSGDVFILDTGADVVQWNGKGAGIFEKSAAAALLNHIEDERDGHAKGRVIEEADDDAVFWGHLGGKGPILDAAHGGSDVEAEKGASEHVLLKLSDASGKFEFTEVAKGEKFAHKLLGTDDVYILDNGEEVIAWVGSKASVGEKKHALQYAQEYVTKHGKPAQTPISRILEGGENAHFNSHFTH